MAIPRYRIGNDLTVLWAINNRDGSPCNLANKEVRLFVVNSRGKREIKAQLTTLENGQVDNVIRWDYTADKQDTLGLHSLIVVIRTAEDHKEIIKDITEAFTLVSRSASESDYEGDENIDDGGNLILSSRLDVYRFGIPKIKIGTNGNWFIDEVDTGKSAIGGGPGLVTNLYQVDDFGKEFVKESVIDTFNAYAINELAKRIALLESDAYLQLYNMTDVLYEGDLTAGQALVWDGTYWANKEVATKGDDVNTEQIESLLPMLDWFEFDKETKQIHAKYGLYTYGGLTAGGKGEMGGIVLNDHGDVSIRDPKDGEALVYDADSQMWINELIKAGDGSATLENDIKVDVGVGNIKKGATLEEGMSLTEILTMMFSQSISTVNPYVSISNLPSDCEVGTMVRVNPSSNFVDGKYKTSNGTISAQCNVIDTKYYLDNKSINVPYELKTSDAKQYNVAVKVNYGDSQADIKDSTGADYPDKIKAGSVESDGTFNVCFRWFFGNLTKDDINNIDSDKVRGLKKTGLINPTSSTVTILNEETNTESGKCGVIAIPEEYGLKEVIDPTFGKSYHNQFDVKTVELKCIGDCTKKYKLFYYDSTKSMGISKISIVK